MTNPILRSSILTMLIAVCACKEKVPEGKPQSALPPQVSQDPVPSSGVNSDSIPLQKPVNEWDRSGGLSAFKIKLIQDLESGNQDQILSAFSETIEFNPGTEKGPAGVVELWNLDGSKEKLGKLKTLLDTLLSNGGCMGQVVGDSAFTAPSYNCLSESEASRCEGRGCGIVSKGGTVLKSSMKPDSEILGNLLENEILTFEANTGCDSLHVCGWRKVTRANGDKGFITFPTLRTESDGFLRIDKGGKGWKIQVLTGPGILSDDV